MARRNLSVGLGMNGAKLPKILVALILLAGTACRAEPEQERPEEEQVENSVQITVLYDNNPYNERLETAWGFGCLVEGTERTILFDTGGSSRILLSNMRRLDVNPARLEAVVISHMHGDHLGGLSGFLEKNPEVTVYLPRSLPERTKRMVRDSGAQLVEVHGPVKLCEGAYSTGELGDAIKEQSLLVESPRGIVLITGCAHPGVVNIVRRSKEQLDSGIHMALGGFHLGGTDPGRVRGIVEEMQRLGVEEVAPCHCSGEPARKLFHEAYGPRYHGAGVG